VSTLLAILAGRAGPFLAGGALMLVLVLAAAVGVQSVRLDRAKSDLINPATQASWQDEARTSAAALATSLADLSDCQRRRANQDAAIAAQKAESDRKLSAALTGRARALEVAESYRRTVDDVRAYQPKGATTCERRADVTGMIRQDLAQ
jgi:hypothetical protein